MQRLKKISLIMSFAIVLATPLWFAVAALGSKFGLWHFDFGLVKMTFIWGPEILRGVTAICILSLIIQMATAPRRGVPWALTLVLTSGMMLWYFTSTVKTSMALPPIHDIQTDWDNPVPAPAELTDFRKENGLNPIPDNPVVPESAKRIWPDAAGKSNAELQQKYYGFVVPKMSSKSSEKLFEIALNTAKDQGWKIESIEETSETRVIHATFTSKWYGFTDDILIRVKPVEKNKSRLDIRSISRVGLSDLGANASRIKNYLNNVDDSGNG